MSDFRQISERQWFFWVSLSTICLTPFGFPTVLYGILEQSAWVPIIAAFVLTIWNIYISLYICRSFPDLNLVQWSKKAMGRWVGGIYSVGAILVMYMWGLLMLYEFLSLLSYTQLPFSVRFLPLSFLIVAVYYLLSRGLEGWIRWGELFAIVLFVGLLLINAPQFTNASFSNLMPFGDILQEPSRYLKPEIWAALFMFRSVFTIFFIYPYIKVTGKLFRWSLFGLTIGFVEILLAIILPITIFGVSFARKLTFPYQESLGTVSLKILPIERITLLTPMVWQMIIVYVLCFSTFCTVEGVRTLIKANKDRTILYIVGGVTFLLGLYPPKERTILMVIMYWSLAGLIIFTLIPTLIWSILLIRGRRSK
jgi:spore germination protein (amino acid permease)